MRPRTRFAATLAVAGSLVLVAWALVVLPLLGMGLAPVPGKEWLALASALVPPGVAAACLLGSGALGLWTPGAPAHALVRPATVAFAGVTLLGLIVARYTAWLAHVIS